MGALTGLKILDFSTLLPGPYATMTLADLGAEVLTVTAPGRPDLVTLWGPALFGTGSSAAAAWLDRNKKSITLNLKKEASVKAVKKLITEGGYDIIMEQFRPGVMKGFGLDYETLSALCPRLIYCSLTGYGQTGPMAMRAGHDINYLARSGNMAPAGRAATGPVLTNMQIADLAAGSMNSIIGILAAVHYRDMTGEGQYIDSSMYDGMIPFNSMDGATFLAGGAEPKREAGLLNGGGIYDFYETKDGRYISIGSLEPKFFANLCKAAGLSEYADGSILNTKEGTLDFKNKLKAVLLSKTLKEWTEIFQNTDACAEPVLTLAEAAKDPHAKERNAFVEVALPGTNRTVMQPGNPLKLSKCPPVYAHAGYPKGTHTGEVLSGLGFSENEIEEMTK